MSAEDELRALEQRRCAALATGDFAVLEALLAPDYVHVHATGRLEERGSLLSALAGGPPRRTTRSDVRLRVWGDAALMVGGIVTTIAPAGGRPGHRITGVATQTWVRSLGSTWQLAALQVTPTEPIERILS
ncbi:nuclear transport factor 2 family protein [Conexibacter sp. CPCC 206217]|uniref:nuclear transport factor 2 family protein n=1 Tax=Conexibacter sp. CPCC 206217 TaxID=3064574 RepID=UPI00272386CF|nr:nuclear transport factor 2 family protein [Conexibacter sp. CPCC 206217]MDO8210139.1 nuclear transport factor 2 family protein [Conexibacter sp. CPCC 206217]